MALPRPGAVTAHGLVIKPKHDVVEALGNPRELSPRVGWPGEIACRVERDKFPPDAFTTSETLPAFRNVLPHFLLGTAARHRPAIVGAVYIVAGSPQLHV